MENITLQQISDLIDSRLEAREKITLQKVSDLLDEKLDIRFGAFEKKIDEKLDIRFGAFEKKIDEKLDIRFKEFREEIIEILDVRFEISGRLLSKRFDEIDKEINALRKDISLLNKRLGEDEKFMHIQGALIQSMS
ncbi:hypothetical protein M0R04_01140 [Candidatus Dojkabacteria bacterium]|jgi:hypothetical protein|nr:hypothetical protein [Candidatus Dojkabacteria bacterium]